MAPHRRHPPVLPPLPPSVDEGRRFGSPQAVLDDLDTTITWILDRARQRRAALSVEARLQWLPREWHCPPEAPDAAPPEAMTPAEEDRDKKQRDALAQCDTRHVPHAEIVEIGERACDRTYADRV